MPDPGSARERVGDPRVALERVEPGHHGEPQRGPGQRAAQRDGAVAELGGDVGGDPRVGRGGRRQHRRAGRQREQRSGEALVVGPEVEAPVGDAVRLVDHEQPAGGRAGRAAARRTAGWPSRSGEISSTSIVPARDVGQHVGPLVDVGGVDGGGAQPGPARPRRSGRASAPATARRRASDPSPRGPQRPRGGPVDGRLAPAGGLHDEHPAPVVDQRPHRDALVVAGDAAGPAMAAMVGSRCSSVVATRAVCPDSSPGGAAASFGRRWSACRGPPSPRRGSARGRHARHLLGLAGLARSAIVSHRRTTRSRKSWCGITQNRSAAMASATASATDAGVRALGDAPGGRARSMTRVGRVVGRLARRARPASCGRRR